MPWSYWIELGKFFFVVLHWCASLMGVVQFTGGKDWPVDRLVAGEMKFSLAVWAVLLILGNGVSFAVSALTGVDLIKIGLMRDNLLVITLAEMGFPILMLIVNKIFPNRRLAWILSGVYTTLVPMITLMIAI